MKNWFLRFTVFYTDQNNRVHQIRGNAVWTLEYVSFLPGTVSRFIEKLYSEKVQPLKIWVNIDFVMEIDEFAVKDYKDKNGQLYGSYDLTSCTISQFVTVSING